MRAFFLNVVGVRTIAAQSKNRPVSRAARTLPHYRIGHRLARLHALRAQLRQQGGFDGAAQRKPVPSLESAIGLMGVGDDVADFVIRQPRLGGVVLVGHASSKIEFTRSILSPIQRTLVTHQELPSALETG
ncbi:hypothetical protein D3C85_1202440 [compost metagenome]